MNDKKVCEHSNVSRYADQWHCITCFHEFLPKGKEKEVFQVCWKALPNITCNCKKCKQERES